MTNLDSILKSRDFTLSTKVCIVKAIVFPVVMYRCESWAIKKAECQRTELLKVVMEKALDSPLDGKEIKPVNPKGNQYSGHLMPSTYSLEKTLMLGKIEGGRKGEGRG